MSKVALVIGGTGGLGRASAEAVAAKGYTTIISGRNTTTGSEVVKAIEAAGGKGVFIACDLCDTQAIRDLHVKVASEYKRIDVAINAAGTASGIGKLETVELERFERLMHLNVTAVFVCMQEQARVMLKQPKQHDQPYHIINFTSIYGEQGCPMGVAYSASKHAIVGMTKSAALEYGHRGIRVNALAPGIIPTGMVNEMVAEGSNDPEFAASGQYLVRMYPQQRFGTPDQVGKAVSYLVDTDWTTGTTLTMDGGFLAGKLPQGLFWPKDE
ncbi:2,5-dichloro-2,5-cyclohexadiene-1,4-diol dehydrogenase [Pseudocercospora fuligena]|uniref:2,5-dichloro-2,5-cyclohexadiene-1,4-diol dehydrogenase n=1 Tax=Pseudocercospora fuligena TaxID=685502 RepID=A0A8H6RNN1_9PEZI|nr:2,5-dichloro-2,5-cyclohexadiene-1,4-diol dehydrogenase [Pseudocercospora fuligena]